MAVTAHELPGMVTSATTHVGVDHADDAALLEARASRES